MFTNTKFFFIYLQEPENHSKKFSISLVVQKNSKYNPWDGR